MKKNYKICVPILMFILSQFTMNAQITFEKVYPTTINQSTRDILSTNDGGYLIAGMTTTNIAGDSDIYMIKTDNVGTILWTKNYGGIKPDYPHKLIATNDGNFFVLGFTMSYGAGGYDAWLLKIDPIGTVLWTKTYGTSADEAGHEIIPTTDGNYMITGEANNDAFLMKIDPSGNTLWTQSYGGTQYETSHSVKQCVDGGYIFVGQTFSLGQGGDTYVVRTDSMGNTAWIKTFGGAYNDEGKFVLANSDGTFIIDGQLSGSSALSSLDINVIKLDASGSTVWNKTYGGNDKDVTHMIQNTADGGYIISGISRSFGWINPKMWLVKIDGGGATTWTMSYGSYYHNHCYAVKQTSDGGYIAIGHQEDNAQITHPYFVKTDGSGQVPVEEFALDNTFAVYPNPTNGIIEIEMSKHAPEGSIYKVSDSMGQLVVSETMDPSYTSGKKIINLEDKAGGVYFISVQSGKNITTKKIILE